MHRLKRLSDAAKLLTLTVLIAASLNTSSLADAPKKISSQLPVAPPKLKMIDAWLINQKTEILGEQLLVLSPLGIKSSNPKSSITLLMTPPFDTVTVYNERAGTIFQSPLNKFHSPMSRTFALFNNYVLGDAPMVKKGEGTVKNFKVTKYQSTKAFEIAQRKLRQERKIPSSNPIIIVSQSSDDFHLPAGAGEALCRLYGLPIVPGIPLQADSKNTDMLPDALLQSTQFTRTKVDAMDFMAPLKYKRLQSIEEITKLSVTEDEMQLFGK